MPEAEVMRARLRPWRRPSRRRRLDERLALGLPGLFAAGSSAVMRLPPRSRLRKTLSRRVSRSFIDAWNRRDFELILRRLDPKVDARIARAHGLPFGPDLEESWRGRAGFERLWSQWLEAWDEFRLEGEEILSVGNRFLVLLQFSGRGRGSGIEITQPVAFLITVRHGLVVRWEMWWEWSPALGELGLDPQLAARDRPVIRS